MDLRKQQLADSATMCPGEAVIGPPPHGGHRSRGGKLKEVSVAMAGRRWAVGWLPPTVRIVPAVDSAPR